MYQTGKNHLSIGEGAGKHRLPLGMSTVTATWGGTLAACFKAEDAHIDQPAISLLCISCRNSGTIVLGDVHKNVHSELFMVTKIGNYMEEDREINCLVIHCNNVQQ